MSESISTTQKWLNALCLPLILLPVDFFLLYLQPQSFAISHFSLAIFTGQALLIIVFAKGKICPGQRERLIGVNKGLILFWGTWLLVSAFSSYHYPKTDLAALCGIGACIAVSLQSKKPQENRLFLSFATALLSIGLITQSLSVTDIILLHSLPFNPFAQISLGVLLSYLLLRLARNRLDNFMQLLPMVVLPLLLINSIFTLAIYWWAVNNGFVFPNEMALIIYFVMHLLLLVLLGSVQLSKKTLSILPLVIIILIAESLPLWASFSYFN